MATVFQLRRAAMAIVPGDDRNSTIMVPQGATIEAIGRFDDSRLMDVRYGGETVKMFTADMKTHTEAVKGDGTKIP
jgi:hypothetical protein